MDITIEELLHLQSLENVFEVDGDIGNVDVEIRSVEVDYSEPVDESSGLNGKKRNFLTQNQRKQLLIELFSKCTPNFELKRGCIKEVADKFHSNRYTVSNMWKQAIREMKADEEVKVLTHKQNCGRKVHICNDEALKEVPLNQRTTMRSFATALGVSSTTVFQMIQKGVIRSHSNSIKPKLTEKYKTERLKFILSFVVPPTVTEKPRFDMLYNMVHIDEKWFFMTKTTQRFYLLSEEEDPYRSCQSKSFITKVMFMGAIARPWLDENGQILWDGKIGIFPFSEEVAAQRGSHNRPRGTIETKPLQHKTKETIRGMILEIVLPKIREKWPSWGCKTIWIQQDNARSHIQPTDPLFIEAAKIDGFEMMLIQQPPQSPDLNILDLGFFRAIQSIQHQTFPDTVTKLITSVKDAYDGYDPRELNHTWLHLMLVVVEVLKVKGGNNYKNPHIGKKKLEREGKLPKNVEVEQTLVNEVVNYLNSNIIDGRTHIVVEGNEGFEDVGITNSQYDFM